MAKNKRKTKQEVESEMESQKFVSPPPGFLTSDENLGDFLSDRGIEAISTRVRLRKRELIYDVKDNEKIKGLVKEYNDMIELEKNKELVLG